MGAIAPALVSQIATFSQLVALIGARVYPQHVLLDDKTYPLITYKFDKTTTIQSYDTTANQLRSIGMTITIVSPLQSDVDNVGNVFQQAFDGQSGTWGGTVVQGCFLDDDGESDDVVTDATTEEILYYIKELTFTVWYVAF